jgi:hypothetical protein
VFSTRVSLLEERETGEGGAGAIARLIRIKRENPFMSWEEAKKREFQDKTRQALASQWSRLLKDNPRLPDYTVSEDVVITDLAHKRKKPSGL